MLLLAHRVVALFALIPQRPSAEPPSDRAPLRVPARVAGGALVRLGPSLFLVNETLPVYLRTHGAGLVEIGLTSAVSFPGHSSSSGPRWWTGSAAGGQWIVACLVLLAAADAGSGHHGRPAHHGAWFGSLLVLMVTLSATQDIAIDAYTIETTTRELGVANSVRIAAYRWRCSPRAGC